MSATAINSAVITLFPTSWFDVMGLLRKGKFLYWIGMEKAELPLQPECRRFFLVLPVDSQTALSPQV